MTMHCRSLRTGCFPRHPADATTRWRRRASTTPSCPPSRRRDRPPVPGNSPMPRAILPAVLLSILAVPAAAQETKSADPAPLQLTAQQDHKLMMEALKIESLRRGADGMNRNAPNAANYDESKANPYPNLP